jgi:phage FluMu protein Com
VKVQCELCREIVLLADFTPSAEGLEIRCPACKGSYFVPAPGRGEARPAASPPPTATASEAPAEPVEEMRCPKCGRRQPLAESCRHCGLVLARWDPDAAAPTTGDDEARRLFAEAEAAWGDPERHDVFIGYCGRAGELPYAARCYRDRLARAPDDAVARAQQARVVTAAELTYLTAPREQADAPVPHRAVLVGAVVALFVALLLALTAPLWRWWH